MVSRAREDVLTSADGSRWDEVLQQVGSYDFCHLAEYNRLAERCGQGQSRMLVRREGDHAIAFPLLLRDVPLGVGAEGGWKDVTSVYGYAGPLATTTALSEGMRARFASFAMDFFRQHRVVSALSRLHPLLHQAPLLSGWGEVVPIGWTLSVDLTAPEEEQWNAYRRNHRQDIRRLRSMGVTCEQAGLECLDAFIEMYYDTMDRVGAARDYYFGREYFAQLLADMPGVAHLYVCRDGGLPVAGGIFTICQRLVQWYLSGSRPDYDGPPPTKLMFDVARRWAIDQGAHTLHLGGGVGGRRDSLYHFKRGFTHREHTYALWRCIVDENVYAGLVRSSCQEAGCLPDDSYFPRYRHPALRGGEARARSEGRAAPVAEVPVGRALAPHAAEPGDPPAD
jgi:Acetyltransferase (GNAT) domain